MNEPQPKPRDDLPSREGGESDRHLPDKNPRDGCSARSVHRDSGKLPMLSDPKHLSVLDIMKERGWKVSFTWEFDHNPNFHARNIVTDTGWKITMDRGLDIFQKYESGPFSIEQAMQEARLTRGVEITYINAPNADRNRE